MPSLEFAEGTDTGNSRDNNEDTYYSDVEAGLWLIADGMGGHAAGEVASAITRDTIAEAIKDGVPLSLAIQKAHAAVLQAVDDKIGAPGMGSTVVALKSQNNDYEIAWVGDSRAYLWSPDNTHERFTQITTDHSYVQMLLASGAIQEEEVAGHPDKNIITQCLGVQDIEQVKVDLIHNTWRAGQWILLCSDGLNEEVLDSTIAEVLDQAGDPADAVQRLIKTALESGGHDNVTVQIIAAPNAGNDDPTDQIGMSHDSWKKYLPHAALISVILLLLYWLW